METARGSAATTVTGRVRRWLSGWGFKEWRRAGLVAVLVATAAFGGLDTVNKQITDLTPGEMFDNGRFEMTVQRATLVDEVRAGGRVLFSDKPGRRYLGLVMKVRNHSTLPGAVYNPIELPGRPGAHFLSSMRVADGTGEIVLGPGLADEAVLVWELPSEALSVGDEVAVRILREVRKLGATYSQGWVRDEARYARLTVPVGGPR
ncbi:hypothetical protein AB4Z39_09520 [Mycobacterium adipatum]|uniref:hypothetical protein n=1 Tax=Mycobacterium adipatum TaxID=1682113 RepID=UPI0034E0801A